MAAGRLVFTAETLLGTACGDIFKKFPAQREMPSGRLWSPNGSTWMYADATHWGCDTGSDISGVLGIVGQKQAAGLLGGNRNQPVVCEPL